MASILLHLLASAGYAALAAYLWRTMPGNGDAFAVDRRKAARLLLFVPLALHTAVLAQSMLRPDGLYLGVGNAVSVIIALAVLIYGVGSLFYRLDALNLLVLPAAAALSLLPLALPAARPLSNTHLLAFKVHLLIALLAYSLFTIASLHVLLMAVVERRLHARNMPPFLQTLPPLLTMEKLLFRIIGAGFVLLTLTLVSGVAFSEELFGTPLQLTHKTVFGILSWIIFGALLAGRAFYGWRGRIATRWTLAGFLSLVLAYIGSRFVIEVILQR
ncbi:MAG TPA: cytochrome c biogenesis protein CcsA [Burkholderiales bacterium]|jgi:ABC-type uncharacterized transport system permease subunit|nr:cytochrome c biogenesis protein CcsA [Burkholderiales bacterium]